MKKVLLFFSLTFLIFALWLSKPQPETLAYNQSPYGMNTGSGRPFWIKQHEIRHQPRMAALLEEAGVKWMRIWALWKLIEPENGQWDEEHLQKVESLLQALQNEKINVSLVLDYPPAWASNPPEGEESRKYPPTNLDDWDDFVRKMANQFAGDLVQAWEIGNEVSGKEGYLENQEVYTKMVQRATRIIREKAREKDSEAIILLSALVPPPDTEGQKIAAIKYWLKTAGPYVDVLNVHKYGSNYDIEMAIWQFKQYADAAEVGNKPIWLTETNICRSHDLSCQDPPDGGEKLKRRFRTALDGGVEKVFWFPLGSGIWGPSILEFPGETVSGEFEPHEPIYSAYREMATGKKTIPLSPGWNKITWPDISGYTAKTALEDIDNDCGAGTAMAIAKKRKDWWESYVKNFGGKNFTLNTGNSYYLNVIRDCTWSP